MQKLGIAPPTPGVDSEAVRKYLKAFRQPLSDFGHGALQSLLGEQVDPVAFNLNVLGLEGQVF
jgi:hypothetical protein